MNTATPFDTSTMPSVTFATSGNSPVRFSSLFCNGGHNHRPLVGGFFVSASGLQLVRRMWRGSGLAGFHCDQSTNPHSVRLFRLVAKKVHTSHNGGSFMSYAELYLFTACYFIGATFIASCVITNTQNFKDKVNHYGWLAIFPKVLACMLVWPFVLILMACNRGKL